MEPIQLELFLLKKKKKKVLNHNKNFEMLCCFSVFSKDLRLEHICMCYVFLVFINKVYQVIYIFAYLVVFQQFSIVVNIHHVH